MPPRRDRSVPSILAELLAFGGSHDHQLAELDRRYGDDPELVAQVAALLEADRGASRDSLFDSSDPGPGSIPEPSGSATRPRGGRCGSTADDPHGPEPDAAAPEPEEPPLEPGTRIGPYRIVRLIGSGGMGTVYRAERLEPYRTTVALKLIRANRRATHRRRFEVERQLHAQLAHPNLVRLLDGGTTADGWPYLVMEYVDGPAISVHCQRNGLDLRARAALMVPVAEGVAAAHAQGIVHRDLTPSNILVGPDGVPRVTDFGLARSLDPDGPEQTRTDGHGQGTPGYVAPEQVRGDTTRLFPPVDCYGLGAVLYRLLTGRRCFAEETSSGSAWLAAADRDPVAPRRINPRIPRDLETIVLRALARDPGERFATAGEFAAELRRFLGGQPLTIRRTRPWVRLGKWAARHRVGVAAWSASFLALLVIALALLARERDQLRRAQDRSNATLKSLSDHSLRMLQTAQALSQENPLSSPVLRRYYEQVVTLFDALGNDNAVIARNPKFRHQWAQAHFQIARALNSSGAMAHDEALGHLDRTIAILTAAIAHQPHDLWLRLDLATAHHERASLWFHVPPPDPGATDRDHQALLAIEAEVVRLWPDDPRWQNVLADHRTARATSLLDSGRVDEARAELERSRAEIRPLVEREPSNPVYRRTLTHARHTLGVLEWQAGRLDAAEARFAEVLAERRQVLALDPENHAYAIEGLASVAALAQVQILSGGVDRALAALGQTGEFETATTGPEAELIDAVRSHVVLDRLRFEARHRLVAAGSPDPTLAADLRAGLDRLARGVERHPEWDTLATDLGHWLADGPLPALRDPARAVEVLGAGVDRNDPASLAFTAIALCRLGRWPEALDLARQSGPRVYPWQFGFVTAWCQAQLGDPEAARAALDAAEAGFQGKAHTAFNFLRLRDEARAAGAALAAEGPATP